MTTLPTNPGAVFIGSLLRDPGEGPWGEGAGPRSPLPPRPQSCSPPGPGEAARTGPDTCLRQGRGPRGRAENNDCDLCGGAGWITVPDPFIGDTLDARCPCGGT